MQLVTRLPRLFGILSVILFFSATCHAQPNAVQVGDLAPAFQGVDERGNIWNSRDHVGKQVVVLYFYPSDFDFCSTLQAARYRDSHQELAVRGATVVGISGDTVACHRMFKDTHQLKQPLIGDECGVIANQFGVPLRDGGKAMVKDADGREILDDDGHAMSIPRKVTAKRWTFIIDQSGRIVYRATCVSPVKDCQEVLDNLCALSSE